MNDCVGDSEENDDIKVVDEVSGSKTEMDERTLTPVGDTPVPTPVNIISPFDLISPSPSSSLGEASSQSSPLGIKTRNVQLVTSMSSCS